MFLLRSGYYPRTLDLAFSRRMITSAFFAVYSLRNRDDVDIAGAYNKVVKFRHIIIPTQLEVCKDHKPLLNPGS